MSTFQGLREVVSSKGLFCALYADRASHYWHTPEAGAKVDKDNPTQVGRALARGRSERMFATLQKRLPQELRLARITTMEEATGSCARPSCPTTTDVSRLRPRRRWCPRRSAPGRAH